MNKESIFLRLRHMEHIISHVTQILCNGYPYHGGERKHFEVMTQITPLGTLGSVASLLAAIFYQELMIGTISSGISYQLTYDVLLI